MPDPHAPDVAKNPDANALDVGKVKPRLLDLFDRLAALAPSDSSAKEGA